MEENEFIDEEERYLRELDAGDDKFHDMQMKRLEALAPDTDNRE